MRIYLGHAYEAICDPHGRVEIYLDPRDLWIGAYVAKSAVYVCLLPAVVIRVSRGRRKMIP